uniref:Uncharacterized protein n=1 Tax=Noccaea caerulescens TaxID=107243 RepID=A0A1J3JIT1_NOCCA
MGRWVIVGAATIPYLGMVIRCLFKDVPVPRYRLGAVVRRSWYLAVMIFMYCISYNSQYGSRGEATLLSLDLILLGISLMQLSYPAGDFNLTHVVLTSLAGLMFASLGVIGTFSSSEFTASLWYFPPSILILSVIDSRIEIDPAAWLHA